MPLFDADIAEVVRSQKKDDEYIGDFSELLRSLAQNYFGPRRYVRFQRELTLAGPLAYYAATTLCGLQTLGEEYVGLIETVGDSSSNNRRSIPSIVRRLAFVLLQIAGPYASDQLLSKLRKRIVAASDVDDLAAGNSDRRQFALRLIDTIRREAIPGLLRLHLASFYVTGRYYHLSKRIVGVRYSSLRANGRSSWDTLPLFRYLGYLSIVQILTSASLWIYSELRIASRSKRESTAIDDNEGERAEKSTITWSSHRCQLCLDDGKPFACTPCGHPFCWDCLVEHVTEQGNCPLCRSNVSASRIVPLLNV